MRLVLICFSLFFVQLHSVWAQKAIYSDAIMSEDMYIVGAVGNTIHAWSVSDKTWKIFKEPNLQLTLHIFSPDMGHIYERTISLGESAITKISFQMEHSFYYANIIYNSSGFDNRLIYKIDATGNLTDVTNVPGLFKNLQYVSASPSTAVNSSNIFAGKILTRVAAGSIADSSLFPGENFDNKQSYERLIVQKITTGSRQLVGEKVYASGYLNFSRLLVKATDSTVYACAFAQSKTDIDKNPYNGSYMFFTRLDTNLVEPADAPLLLKKEKWPADLQYLIPNAIFSLNNRLLVLSTGIHSITTYSSGNIGYGGSSFPKASTFDVPGSIMITQTDKNNRPLTDTIIRFNEGRGQLDWGNRFILPASNEVLLFCLHPYTASKAGITVFTIGQNGKIDKRDLNVYENYSYALRQAFILEPGVLLVPYTYKRKTGLMRLAYVHTE